MSKRSALGAIVILACVATATACGNVGSVAPTNGANHTSHTMGCDVPQQPYCDK